MMKVKMHATVMTIKYGAYMVCVKKEGGGLKARDNGDKIGRIIILGVVKTQN